MSLICHVVLFAIQTRRNSNRNAEQFAMFVSESPFQRVSPTKKQQEFLYRNNSNFHHQFVYVYI